METTPLAGDAESRQIDHKPNDGPMIDVELPTPVPIRRTPGW